MQILLNEVLKTKNVVIHAKENSKQFNNLLSYGRFKSQILPHKKNLITGHKVELLDSKSGIYIIFKQKKLYDSKKI